MSKETNDSELSARAVCLRYLEESSHTFDRAVEAVHRWCAPDVRWEMPGNVSEGVDGIVNTLHMMRGYGVEYLTFQYGAIMDDGHTVITERVDELRSADGTLLLALPMVGIQRVQDGKIVYGKDFFFDVAPLRELFGLPLSANQ